MYKLIANKGRVVSQTLWIMLFCLCSINVNAKANVDQLLQKSGLLTQIEAVPTMMKAGFAQAANNPNMSTDVLEKVIELADKHVNVAAFKKTLAVALTKQMSDKEIQQVMQWYQSDLGKKIVAADAQATDPNFIAQTQQQAQTLMQDTKRIEFAGRIDSLLGLTDRMVDMQTNVTIAMYGVMGAMSGQAMETEMLRSQVSAQMASQRSRVETMIAVMTVATYKDFSEQQLNQYEQFVNSDAGRQFNQLVFNHLLTWIEQSSTAWIESVVKLTQQAPKTN